jgi:hypothetical protein
LSTWFRDYIYIPLGGSKKGSVRTYVNVLLVFLISGLWHGASWMFVIWGAIHGLYQLYEKATYNFRDRLWKITRLDGTWIQWSVKWSITMGVVLVSWVFFRATSIEEVVSIFSSLSQDIISGSLFRELLFLLRANQIGLGVGTIRIVAIFLSVVLLEFFQIIDEFKILKNVNIIYLQTTIAIYAIILMGNFGLQEFIYFQF